MFLYYLFVMLQKKSQMRVHLAFLGVLKTTYAKAFSPVISNPVINK